MPLDIGTRTQLQRLVDVYGELLTDHQREVLTLYLERDWSYAEIAASEGVSRAAVHDLVRRTGATLTAYEAKLGLVAASDRRDAERDDLRNRLDTVELQVRELRKSVKGFS